MPPPHPHRFYTHAWMFVQHAPGQQRDGIEPAVAGDTHTCPKRPAPFGTLFEPYIEALARGATEAPLPPASPAGLRRPVCAHVHEEDLGLAVQGVEQGGGGEEGGEQGDEQEGEACKLAALAPYAARLRCCYQRGPDSLSDHPQEGGAGPGPDAARPPHAPAPASALTPHSPPPGGAGGQPPS